MAQPNSTRRDREARRLAILDALQLIGSEPEAEYDSIASLAAQLLDMPHAGIALVDADRYWLKAHVAMAAQEMPRHDAFCDQVISDDAELIIDDLASDSRFRESPLVTAGPQLRFYAGMPIRIADDEGDAMPVGTLCVLDTRPRALDANQRAALRHLASLAEALVKARAIAHRATEIATLAQTQATRITQQERIFREAERMALIGSWRLDLASDTVSWSEGVYRIHGLSPGKAPTLDRALRFYPPHHRAMVSEQLAVTVETGRPFDFQVDFVTATGDHRRVRSRGEREDRDGVPIAVVGVFQDITDHHAVTVKLQRSAEMDELTGIANRASFNRRARRAVEAAQAEGTPLLLALIDLDGFKQVNDTLGHLAGDDVLRAVGQRLRAPWLKSSFAARLGGDEFALIITDPSLAADPRQLAERLQEELSVPVAADGMTIASGGTVGTAMLGEHDDLRDLIREADANLYAAKRRRIGNRRRTDRRSAA